MNTFLNIDWTAVLAVVGSLAVGALMFWLIARIQLRRPGIQHEVRPHLPLNWDWNGRVG